MTITRRAGTALVLAMLSTHTFSAAAPPAPSSSATPKVKPLGETLTGEAKTDYETAKLAFGDKDWALARAKYQSAYDKAKDARLLWNIAACEKQLRHYARARALVRRFLDEGKAVNGPDDEKAAKEFLELTETFVTPVKIDVNVEGVEVSIDDEAIGTSPFKETVVVDIGKRRVVAKKSGYRPFDKTVGVGGEKDGTIVIAMEKEEVAAGAGKVKVTESTGLAVDVLVDSAVVGKTPYEAAIGAGSHTIALRGLDETGTDPQSITIESGKTLELKLTSKPLEVETKIIPTPADALVTIDGKAVGSGTFHGKLTRGTHTIEVSASGHLTKTKEVVISAGKPALLQIELEPWRRFAIELSAGYLPVVLLNSLETSYDNFGGFGQERAAAPTGSSRAAAAFLRFGFAIGRHVSLEVGGAFISMKREINLFIAASTGTENGQVSGTQFVGLNGPAVLLSASLHYFESTPLTLRFHGGVTFLTARFFSDVPLHVSVSSRNGNFSMPTREESGPSPILGPEISLGYRVSAALTLDLGLIALFGFAPKTDQQEVTGPAPPAFPSVTVPLNRFDDKHVYMLFLPTLGGRFEL